MTTNTRSTQIERKKTDAVPPESALSVRMYDVGFGDCFLLRIPTPEGMRKLLFDCGSIKTGSKAMAAVVRQLIEDIREVPGQPARIDVVVATHRHRDHISGFSDPAWAEVEVGEVWMPWTENPQDADGRRIREMQTRLAILLTEHIKMLMAAASDTAERTHLEHYHELALNALSNERAMRTLQRGFAGKPVRRYLPRRNTNLSWFVTSLLPGVTIHVLGPSLDPEIIRELEPPAGQTYLKLAESLDAFKGEIPSPFGMDWRVESADYQSNYSLLSNRLEPDERQSIRNVGLGFDESVAAALDKAINGTSLMLSIQLGSATLLFPGDAQWGTWRKALENPEFRKLLSETNFYKVGHHGSHNATPVEFVEQVAAQDFWTMVSTNSMPQWPSIPKEELLAALGKKTKKIARSDQLNAAKKPFLKSVKDGVIEARLTV